MYRLSDQFKTLYFTVYVTIAIVTLGLYFYFLTPSCFVFFLFLIAIIDIERRRRFLDEEAIIFSTDELEYRKLGSGFTVHWKNIQKISKCWYLYKQDCLVIDKSFTRITEMSLWGDRLLHRFIDPQDYVIPLSCFDKNWRSSEIGQHLRQHAPHLFESEQA